MTFSSWIVSFDFVLPRVPLSPAFGSVAFSMPLGLRFDRLKGGPLYGAII